MDIPLHPQPPWAYMACNGVTFTFTSINIFYIKQIFKNLFNFFLNIVAKIIYLS